MDNFDFTFFRNLSLPLIGAKAKCLHYYPAQAPPHKKKKRFAHLSCKNCDKARPDWDDSGL